VSRPRSPRGRSKSRHAAAARPKHGRDTSRGPRRGAHAARPAPPQARRPERERGQVHALAERTLRLPDSVLVPGAPPALGEHLWTTRPGSERDLVEELWLLRAEDGRVVGPSLVASRQAPHDAHGRHSLTFARQGFAVRAVVSAPPGELAQAVASAASKLLVAKKYALQVWVPDADATNALAPRVPALERAVLEAFERDPNRSPPFALERHVPQDVVLLQVCLVGDARAYVGVVPVAQALSLAPGGRERMRVSGQRPSRAARKLEEAFRWAGMAPGPGELCVDLGAAPGGWTFVVRARGARAIAVDPAHLAPEIAADRGVRHVQASAFTFEPETTVDFLLCDMAFRPLDVAALLAKWARRRWARALLANFKLPMKRRAEMARHLCTQLSEAGWKEVRARQLYHDRDEITVCARL